MKTKRIVSVLALATLVGSAAACDNNLTSINHDPNNPTDVPPPSILPNALQAMVNGTTGNTWWGIKMGAVWAQQISEVQYRDEDKYITRPGIQDGQVWGQYSGPLEDFQKIIDKGTASKTPNWDAVGRILKSYDMALLTEAMGDIPYSEALKGGDALTPKYDKQADVYKGLFADLQKASAEIAPSGVGFPSGDILFDGDMVKWKRFANSLMLRYALHLSKADPTTGAAMAKAAMAGGVMQSNDDNAELMYLSGSPNQNPIFNDAKTRDDYGLGKAFVDSMTVLNDPRLPIFAQPAKSDGAYRGLPPGLNDGEGPPIATISRIGALWRSNGAAPMPLQQYAEVLFLQAEAAQRGWISGDPAALYTAGIRASMEGYGISDADIAKYLAQPGVPYNAARGLHQIGLQKWFSLFMNGIEAYTEIRRTGEPSIVPGLHAVLKTIPSRIPYADNEQTLNKANVDAAVAAQGFSSTTDMSTKMWLFK